MENRGLIHRRRSGVDKRSVLLSVTRTGEKVVEQVARFGFRQLQVEAPGLLKTLRRLLVAKIK
jgi:DNA-binding MarR family transcriptional regulator